jgi:hypothetical protein
MSKDELELLKEIKKDIKEIKKILEEKEWVKIEKEEKKQRILTKEDAYLVDLNKKRRG